MIPNFAHDTPLAIVADWCEEHGHGEEGEYLRLLSFGLTGMLHQKWWQKYYWRSDSDSDSGSVSGSDSGF